MRSTDWAYPACLVWDSKQCKISKYVHRNTPLQHWRVPAAWCSQIKHYTVVLSHPFRSRSYEEKLSRKRGSPSSWVNGKKYLIPLPEPTVLAHTLIVSSWPSWSRWVSQCVCLEKRWISWEGDATFTKGWTGGLVGHPSSQANFFFHVYTVRHVF